MATATLVQMLVSVDWSTNMNIKVTVISAFQKPEEHYFDDWGNAEEFALAMREQQFKTVVEEVD